MHTDNTTSNAARRAVALLLVAAAVGTAAFAGTPGPRWLPGFPLRAGTSVILMWSPVPEATAYRLLKGSGDGDFVEIYEGSANAYQDTDAGESGTFRYKVVAVGNGGESAHSPIATVKGAEEANPPTMTGVLSYGGSLAVRWSAPPGAVFYNVYRSEAVDGPAVLVAFVKQETYVDEKAEEGKYYYYRVSLVDKNGKESRKSAPVAAILRKTAGVAEEPGTLVRAVASRGIFRGEESDPLDQPRVIGVTGEGEVFVVDRRSIRFFDVQGSFLRGIEIEKNWGQAIGVAPDRDGKILLAFHANGMIRKIDRTGEPVAEIREIRDAENRRVRPIDIAVDSEGNYWIVDGAHSRVVKTNGSGEILGIVGRAKGTYTRDDMMESDLPAASRIRYNPVDGRIYVLLGLQAEIKAIDPKSSRVVKTFGGRGTAGDKFQGVGGLAFRRNGNILVLDQLMQVIKEFGPDYAHVANYADIVGKGAPRLSTNFISTFAFNESANRFYLCRTVGSLVYIYDIDDQSPP